MADERLRIKIEADAKRAERDLETLAKLGDELTDDDLTIVVRAKADAAEGEVKRLTKLLAGADDPVDIKVITTGIRQAKDEIEQLTRLVEKADAETIDIDTSRTVKNLDDVGKSADSSKSVLANMVGNASQDFGALGGLAGSAGVAIGQMGEYMVDAAADGDNLGQILRNFGKVAGPIALISGAIAIVTGLMGELNKRAQESAARTKEFGEAMKTAADDSTGLADVLRT